MLHGKLVTLRPMERSDIPRLWEFAQDVQIGLVTGQAGRPTSLAAIENLFEERYGHAGGADVYFAIEAHDLLIGGVEIREIDWQNRSARMIVYIGDPTYRRRGCGTDALTLAVNYAFKLLGLNRLAYEISEENDGARIVYSRVGFKEEGRLREAHYQDHEYHDAIQLALLRREWDDERRIEEFTQVPEPGGLAR